jgi:hypothetical protein
MAPQIEHAYESGQMPALVPGSRPMLPEGRG